MATALIAEDESLLAAALQAELALVWPELEVLATVGDGASAVAQALQLQPDVLFFDIQMPGLNGLDAAAELLEAWPLRLEENSKILVKPFPALVFVTAYDQYAVAAFEAQAVDYLLKPVQPARLLKTVLKLQSDQQNRAQAAIKSIANEESLLEQTMAQLRALLQVRAQVGTAPLPRLLMIAATQSGSQGNTVCMVPVADVLVFEAADKYIRVLTAQAEFLIRIPLKDLLQQLDSQTFWQIHRGTLVRAAAIHTVSREDSGRLSLRLHGHMEKLPVSRLYSHLFKAM